MDKTTFEQEMQKALTMTKMGYRPDYWQGYQQGLLRAYYGEKFGTSEEHEIWKALADDPEESRQERGRGYQDGLKVE